MISQEILKQYRTTIGIECHVQFNTTTKLFSAASNNARDARPNTLINHIDFGMPGALPVLNKKAVEYGVRAAFALNTEPETESTFDRKHYFYPDLPMGYQITQFYHPIIKSGHVDIVTGDKPKRIHIHEAHLEADAGKSTHPANKNYSLVDLNRAGTPLLEIVSEPEIHSPAEARDYAHELYLLMKYAGISDVDLFHGNMRFDVNVSVSKTEQLGTRTETKNLNSFRSVEKAAEYEVHRQIELLEKGQPIVQETRGWDDAKQRTFPQRSKEDAHDYRYMPEPDVPPIVLAKSWLAEIRASMPLMPADLRQAFSKLGLDHSTINTLVEEMPAGLLIMTLLDKSANSTLVKRVVNWLVTEVKSQLTDTISWGALTLNGNHLIELAELVENGKISSTGAKTVLFDMIKNGGSPLGIAEKKNVLQVSDEGALAQIVKDVLAANPQAAADVQNGEMKAIGFLVGQVMKASKGQANPSVVQNLLKKQIGV